mgnify:CR=1 FL=1
MRKYLFLFATLFTLPSLAQLNCDYIDPICQKARELMSQGQYDQALSGLQNAKNDPGIRNCSDVYMIDNLINEIPFAKRAKEAFHTPFPLSPDVGYVFVSNLQSYSQKSINSKAAWTISKGKVAIADDDNKLSFACNDCVEYMVLKSGAFHEYYPQAQEEVPAEYVATADYNKAVRKVNVHKRMPDNWKMGKVYHFKTSSSDYTDSIKLRTVRLSGKNVSLITDYDGRTINISGESLVEITFDNGYKSYLYKGNEVVPASSASGEYCSLVVDDNGLTYSQSENGSRRVDTKLSYNHNIPEVAYFGWISDVEIVLNDYLYVAF